MDWAGKIKEKFDADVSEVNFGGGFGVRYTDEVRKPYKYFLDPMMELLKKRAEEIGIACPDAVIEPGRSIVAEAGVTLYKVGQIKSIPGVRKYVSVDGGMADNPRFILYEAKYTAVLANDAKKEPSEIVTVAGKCCESGDVLLKDALLPEIKPGDTLAVLATGAYNYSMASNYNRIPRPCVVSVSGGRARVVIKRETYEDLIKNDVM